MNEQRLKPEKNILQISLGLWDICPKILNGLFCEGPCVKNDENYETKIFTHIIKIFDEYKFRLNLHLNLYIFEDMLHYDKIIEAMLVKQPHREKALKYMHAVVEIPLTYLKWTFLNDCLDSWHVVCEVAGKNYQKQQGVGWWLSLHITKPIEFLTAYVSLNKN